jgi:hypothetical protein
MAIISGITNSFKLEMVTGIHDLSADTIKAALYTSSAELSPDTTAYSSSNEATGTNWSAGGQTLALASGYPKLLFTAGLRAHRPVAWAFQDALVANVTITFRAVLLYNSSKSNRAMAVIDKGVDQVITAGPLTLFTRPDMPYLIILQ